MGGSSQPVKINQSPANDAEGNLQSYVGASSNAQVQNLLSNYASGGASLSDTLKAMQGLNTGSTQGLQDQNEANAVDHSNSHTLVQTGGGPNFNGAGLSQGAMDQLATNPLTAGLLAQSQVGNNSLFSGLFGKNGMMGQAENAYTSSLGNLAQDRQALSGNDSSYGLQQSDLAAYGQGADQIGRQSAQQSQGIAQALASRGLGSSNNGAAISSYAGNYGNQMEQLAGLQNTISQNRINTASQLAQARNSSDLAQNSNAANTSTALGAQASAAYNSQLNSNLTGAQNNYNEMAGAAASGLNQVTGEQNMANAAAGQQAAQTSGIGTMIGTGVGAVAGGYLGGPAGATAGASAGGSLGGQIGK